MPHCKPLRRGDRVTLSRLNRTVNGTVLAVIPNSEPSPRSRDYMCRVQIAEDHREVVVLRRMSELQAAEEEVSLSQVVPVDSIYE